MATLIGVIVQGLAGLAVLLVALLDYWWSDRRTLRFKRARRVLLAVIGILVLLGTGHWYWQAVSADAREAQQMGWLTGGDTKCWVSLAPDRLSPDVGVLSVSASGDFPLRNVHLQVVDKARFDALMPAGGFVAATRASTTYFVLEEVNPLRVSEFAQLSLAGLDRLDLSISIFTPNRNLHEILRAIKMDGRWESAVQVIEVAPGPMGEVVYTVTSANYPRTAAGDVDW